MEAQPNQATEHIDVESRIAELIEKQVQVMKAKAIEKHNQAIEKHSQAIEKHNQAMEHYDSVAKSRLAKVVKKLRASRRIKAMEGMDYVDRGHYYEVVIKGPFIDRTGRIGVALTESQLREDFILFSGVPPITVKYPKTPVGPSCISNLQAVKDVRSSIMRQVNQTIREAPNEIHAAYRRAYYKAIKEYDERVKIKPPVDEDEDIEKIRDELLSLAKIKADQIIRDEQIRTDQIRASHRKASQKDFGNQTGQVDPQNVNVDLAAMLSVKGTFDESDIEKQISDRQALAELKAKLCIDAARAKADRMIECGKALLASTRESSKKNYRDLGEARKRDEALLGFLSVSEITYHASCH